MAPTPAHLSTLQRQVWHGSLPVEIRLASKDCKRADAKDVFLISLPRLSYLPPLLPQLHDFFHHSISDPSIPAHEAWLSYSGLPMKWHYPIGLLYDLFSGAAPTGLDRLSGPSTSPPHPGSTTTYSTLPWRLTLHYTSHPSSLIFPLDPDGRVLRDAFTNAVKEADFIRTGSAKNVMSLSKADSDALWTAISTHDLALYTSVSDKLLNPPGMALRHVPIKIYLPTTVTPARELVPETVLEEEPAAAGAGGQEQDLISAAAVGSVRVVQGLVPPERGRQRTTLGVALNELLPGVFPSRRNPVIACPVLHGAVVPMAAVLEDLARAAAYTDGWLHVAVALLG